MAIAGCCCASASTTPADLVSTFKRIAELTPLTDPRTVLESLGVSARFNVRLLRDHVQISVPLKSLDDTPYQSVYLLPFVDFESSQTQSNSSPDRSHLSVSINQFLVCVTKADVITVFGESFATTPIISTDGGGGTYMGYQIQRPRGTVGSATFVFHRPERCASGFQLRAPF